MKAAAKIKVLRVVTVHECVLWHLGKTLHQLANLFDLTVAGEGVSRYAAQFPNITWIDLNISRKISPWQDLKALFNLFMLCRKLSPDIVHSIMPKAGLLSSIAARAAGTAVRMHTFTGQVWDTKTGLSRWLFQCLDRLVVTLNSVCLTDSPSQSLHLANHGITMKGRPLPVLGQGSLIGVDLERFDRARIAATAEVTRDALGLSDQHFVIAYIARKSRDKGAMDMLRAFAMAASSEPHMRLLFIGPDESDGELDRLRRSQPELFDQVIERGTVSNHEEYLFASDVLCMPSYREGFGSVVIDAAALGVPCVGSRIPGLVDAIADGITGLLHRPGDIVELAALLQQLNKDRGHLGRLGQQALTRARSQFSSEVMGELLADFYRAQLASAR